MIQKIGGEGHGTPEIPIQGIQRLFVITHPFPLTDVKRINATNPDYLPWILGRPLNSQGNVAAIISLGLGGNADAQEAVLRDELLINSQGLRNVFLLPNINASASLTGVFQRQLREGGYEVTDRTEVIVMGAWLEHSVATSARKILAEFPQVSHVTIDTNACLRIGDYLPDKAESREQMTRTFST
ncbi:MAG: hypothetical protein ACREGI_04435, partial [Candidatus Levyibacteriota bacterium]